jgi:hypothetical protein
MINNPESALLAATEQLDAQLVWIGEDDRGVELEIVALDRPDAVVVIHVMLTDLRRWSQMPDSMYSRLGPDIPDDEELRDGRGRVVEDTYVAAAVEDAVARVRGRGRPSLSASGESPVLQVRLSPELDSAVRDAAERAGVSRSDWVRSVLGAAARRAGWREGPP